MDTPLTRCTPESVGIASSAIQAFVEGTEERVGGLHSFMLLRHGKVAAEAWWAPYAPERPHMLFSLSKSFTSTAVGLAVAEGLLTVEDPVLDYFPEETPRRVSRNLAAMRIKHLLSMNTGQVDDTLPVMTARRDGDWARAFFSVPVKHKPGSHFLYNTGATYMLSAIVQRVTGQTLIDYLTPRLFEPLGIEGAEWETCPKGVNTGGFGLKVRTADIARLGQMYLQKGVWRGRRILPAAWVEEATSFHSDNSSQPAIEWQQGYGYQFWLCRHGAYRGDGAFGQYCLVMPEQDAVLAITSGIRDMQTVFDLVWEHLLPAMAPDTLPEAPEAQVALRAMLAERAIAPAQGALNSPQGTKLSGRYRLNENDFGLKALTLRFKRKGVKVRMVGLEGVSLLSCAPGVWQEAEVTPRPARNRSPRRLTMPTPPLEASGAWLDEATYLLRLCYGETPFVFDLRCHFDGDHLTVEGSANTSFGPTEWPKIEGQRG